MNHLIKSSIATLHFSNGIAAPTEDFWEAWHTDKEAVKSEGYFVRKMSDKFIVTTEHPSSWYTEPTPKPTPRTTHRTRKPRVVNRDNYPLVDTATKARVMKRYRRLKGVQE